MYSENTTVYLWSYYLGTAASQMEPHSRLSRTEAPHGISPYCLPVINNFVTPVPPATKRKERAVKVAPSCTLRGRRLRPTTSFSGSDVSEVSISLYVFPGGKFFHNKHTSFILDKSGRLKISRRWVDFRRPRMSSCAPKWQYSTSYKDPKNCLLLYLSSQISVKCWTFAFSQ